MKEKMHELEKRFASKNGGSAQFVGTDGFGGGVFSLKPLMIVTGCGSLWNTIEEDRSHLFQFSASLLSPNDLPFLFLFASAFFHPRCIRSSPLDHGRICELDSILRNSGECCLLYLISIAVGSLCVSIGDGFLSFFLVLFFLFVRIGVMTKSALSSPHPARMLSGPSPHRFMSLGLARVVQNDTLLVRFRVTRS